MSTSVMKVILLNQESLQRTWGTIQKLAQNREEWRSFVAAQCLTAFTVDEWVSAVSDQAMKMENSIFIIKKGQPGLISVVSYV